MSKNKKPSKTLTSKIFKDTKALLKESGINPNSPRVEEYGVRMKFIKSMEAKGYSLIGYSGRYAFKVNSKPHLVIKVGLHHYAVKSNKKEFQLFFNNIKNKDRLCHVYYISDDYSVMVCERLYKIPNKWSGKHAKELRNIFGINNGFYVYDIGSSNNVMFRREKGQYTSVVCDYAEWEHDKDFLGVEAEIKGIPKEKIVKVS